MSNKIILKLKFSVVCILFVVYSAAEKLEILMYQCKKFIQEIYEKYII